MSCSDERPPARMATRCSGHYARVTGVVGATNLPTAIVTTVPGAACDPPGGSWVWTIPSWLGSVTGWRDDRRTPKPEAFSCCLSVALGERRHVWDAWTSSGPFDTVTVIVAPGGWNVPDARAHVDDRVPSADPTSTSVALDCKSLGLSRIELAARRSSRRRSGPRQVWAPSRRSA